MLTLQPVRLVPRIHTALAQTTKAVTPTQLASVVRVWGSSDATATPSASVSSSTQGRKSLTYAECNFGGVPLNLQNQQGCYATYSKGSSSLPDYMTAVPDGSSVCKKSGAKATDCSSNDSGTNVIFTDSICVVDKSSINLNIKYCGSGSANPTSSPTLGYSTMVTCPVYWSGRSTYPWAHAQTPSISGKCNDYKYECTNTKYMLFGIAASNPPSNPANVNTQAVFPFFTFPVTVRAGPPRSRRHKRGAHILAFSPLATDVSACTQSQLGITTQQICVTSFSLNLFVISGSSRLGCDYANYRATLYGTTASAWYGLLAVHARERLGTRCLPDLALAASSCPSPRRTSTSLTYNVMKNNGLLLTAQSADLGSGNYNSGSRKFTFNGNAAVLDVVNNNIRNTNNGQARPT